jgi:purine-binding chemotaxis protein CheW
MMSEKNAGDKKAINESQLVIFRLSGEEFGLEISQVREIIRIQDITPMPKAPEFIEGVINLRGQIIAVMDLAKRFTLAHGNRTDKTRIIVTEAHGSTVGLVVDEVPEVLRLATESIEPAPNLFETQIHTDFIRGVGKVDERLIILLNVDKILSKEEARQVGDVVER